MKKNEPAEIPASMGAVIIGGYNNWDRIWEYKRRWQLDNPETACEVSWKEEFSKLVPRKPLYQDRFILLSRGPYSGVKAEDLQLTEAEWRRKSLLIRLEHECTHYFTRRVFGSMRNNIFDELTTGSAP